VLRFGDVTMTYDVPIVEIYLAHTLPDASSLAVVSPPWTPLPWPVVALLEEAVTRGVGAFSAEAAKRRGVPWLDVVSDVTRRRRARRREGRPHRDPGRGRARGAIRPRAPAGAGAGGKSLRAERPRRGGRVPLCDRRARRRRGASGRDGCDVERPVRDRARGR